MEQIKLESQNHTDPNAVGGPERHLNIDCVLNQIGGFGRYHMKQVFLLWLMTLSAGPGLLSFAFTGRLASKTIKVPVIPIR